MPRRLASQTVCGSEAQLDGSLARARDPQPRSDAEGHDVAADAERDPEPEQRVALRRNPAAAFGEIARVAAVAGRHGHDAEEGAGDGERDPDEGDDQAGAPDAAVASGAAHAYVP